MSQNDAEFEYVKGQMRESFGPLLADFERRNVQALALPGWELDVPYGNHPREVFDLLPAGPGGRGTVVYFHAGYWQSRDKAQFRFLAPAFNALGWHVALVNYPLCPEVDITRIVKSASSALKQVAAHQSRRGHAGPIVLCGHSAGAHLVVELALQHASGDETSCHPLAGIIPISGIFDLQDLVSTSLNERLQLGDAQALACSPVYRARPGAAPAVFIVGGTETRTFESQTLRMARAWQQQGNQTRWQVAEGADHFSVLQDLCGREGVVDQFLQSWAGSPRTG